MFLIGDLMETDEVDLVEFKKEPLYDIATVVNIAFLEWGGCWEFKTG
jgi:hypothetical protein